MKNSPISEFDVALESLGLDRKSFAAALKLDRTTVAKWVEPPRIYMIVLEQMVAQAQWLRGFGVKVG
jgi:hypothetical protein